MIFLKPWNFKDAFFFLPRSIIKNASGEKVVLVVKVLNISTLFLNYVLNELPQYIKAEISMEKVWRC